MSGLLVPRCAESVNFGANFQAIVVFETLLRHLEISGFSLDCVKGALAKTKFSPYYVC